MSTVQRGPGVPVVAIALGALGALLLLAGLAGLFAPDLVAVAPVLREPLVAGALASTGAVFCAIELVLVLIWIRRRNETARQAIR